MISERSKLSLCQLLKLQPIPSLWVLLRKYDIDVEINYLNRLDRLVSTIEDAQPSQLRSLLEEVVRTQRDLRNQVETRPRYDERWKDLELSLLLDGYRVKKDQLVAIDPTIEGAEPLDDDLTALLRVSGLPQADQVISVLDRSADAFKAEPLDLNACLTEARLALETAARDIARERQNSRSGNYAELRWSPALTYLKTSGFITQEEEKGLVGVYGFVSPGAHRPVEPDELEMARLGRSLSIGMLYFLVKRYMESE